MTFSPLLLVALVLGQSPAASAPGAHVVDAWAEVPVPYALVQNAVQVTDLKVRTVGRAEGNVSVEFELKLQNTGPAVMLEVAMPLGHTVDDPFLGGTLACTAERGPVTVTLNGAPVPGVERRPVDNLGPYAGFTEADIVKFALAKFAEGTLVVRTDTPWGRARAPRFAPRERGFSVGLAGLSTFDPPVQTLTATMTFEPHLLGPASVAEPLPYKYTSRDLDWVRENLGTGRNQTPVPPRLSLRVFDGWSSPGFAGVLTAYWTREAGDDYPWNKQFLWLSADTSAEGNAPIGLAAFEQITKAADEAVNEILARNGASFKDTFVQMQYQKMPWYKPRAGFTENQLLAVEKWNLQYARCIQRAARTSISMLSKTGNATVDVSSRLYKMVLRPFERCDQQFWEPRATQAPPEGGLSTD